jgi:hypothetical protein
MNELIARAGGKASGSVSATPPGVSAAPIYLLLG